MTVTATNQLVFLSHRVHHFADLTSYPTTMPTTDRKAIEYNLIWMERTFKERSTTERLLAPELENGILSQHDYDLAVNFLPGLHRHYNVRVSTNLRTRHSP